MKKSRQLNELEGYEEFKSECVIFRCSQEYPGWDGVEKYGIITDRSEDELRRKYPAVMDALSPFILLGTDYGEVRAESLRNDSKFSKRNTKNHSFFEIDDTAEKMYPELSVQDVCTESIEIETEREMHLYRTYKCREAFYRLTKKQQEYLLRRYLLGESAAQIAKEEQCTVQGVYHVLERAKKNFELFFGKRFNFGTFNSMHNEGIDSVLQRISSSKKENQDCEAIHMKKLQEEDIITLCPKCLCNFRMIPGTIIKRLDPFQTVREECTYCSRPGYDYVLITKRKTKRR